MTDNRENEILSLLKAEGNLRCLRTMETRGAYVYDACDAVSDNSARGREYYNLSSNDYLGLAEPGLQNEFLLSMDFDRFLFGNPSSRLMTGNSAEYGLLEDALCDLFDAEAALVLSSGFAANSGVLPAVVEKGDLVLADKLVHASIIDGLKLCGNSATRGAVWQRFRHNDMEHLEALLSGAMVAGGSASYGRIIVATESLFSMDGDFAPLDRLAELQHKYGFLLYLDEAHAFGVYGTSPGTVSTSGGVGCGLLAAYNAAHPELPLAAEYLVVTFGKALASQGAAVVCSAATKELLVNRMRPLIFSTALPDISLLWTRFLLAKLPEFEPRRERLRQLIAICNAVLEPSGPFGSQIVPIRAGTNENALRMAEALREEGFWATAIRHPTVPRGEARLRISLCASHTPYKIEQFASLCKRFG